MSYLAKQQAKQEASQRAYIANLQALCLPGQKLLTCSYCKKICRVPEWQIELNCVIRTIHGKRNRPTHPGEITR